jgi:hypothetical protein
MEDNTKTKQMFAVAMKKESDEESSSCPDGSFVGDHEYHLRQEVVSIMENITPTNPETETADSSQADNPAAEALLAAQTEFAQKTSSLLISYQDRLNEIRDDNAIEDTPRTLRCSRMCKSQKLSTRASRRPVSRHIARLYSGMSRLLPRLLRRHRSTLRASERRCLG